MATPPEDRSDPPIPPERLDRFGDTGDGFLALDPNYQPVLLSEEELDALVARQNEAAKGLPY